MKKQDENKVKENLLRFLKSTDERAKNLLFNNGVHRFIEECVDGALASFRIHNGSTVNHYEADDLRQNAYLKILEKITPQKVEGARSIKNYLFYLAKNSIIDRFRYSNIRKDRNSSIDDFAEMYGGLLQ